MRSRTRRLTVAESSSPPKSELMSLPVMNNPSQSTPQGALPPGAAGDRAPSAVRSSGGGVSQVQPSPGLLRSGDLPVQQPGHGGDPLDLGGVGLGQPARAVPQGVLQADAGVPAERQGDRSEPDLRG